MNHCILALWLHLNTMQHRSKIAEQLAHQLLMVVICSHQECSTKQERLLFKCFTVRHYWAELFQHGLNPAKQFQCECLADPRPKRQGLADNQQRFSVRRFLSSASKHSVHCTLQGFGVVDIGKSDELPFDWNIVLQIVPVGLK